MTDDQADTRAVAAAPADGQVARPQPPAMTPLEVAMVGEPCHRIRCADDGPHTLWAGRELPDFGADVDGGPAEAVWQAAGCRDEPRTCPCAAAASGASAAQEVVAQVAVAPLAAASLRAMSGGIERGPLAATQPGEVPALATLAGPIDLTLPTWETPTISDRPIVALSGQQAMGALAQVWAQAAADGSGTFADAAPVDDPEPSNPDA